MSHRSVPCQRDGCGNEFTVDLDQESGRCPSCGKEHSAPWDQYDDDGADGEALEEDAPGDEADVHVEGDGVQVTITIDVQPLGGAAR